MGLPIQRQTEYGAFPHQHEVLSSETALTMLLGGVGSGKTDAGAWWALRQIMRTPPGSIGIIAANTYDQLIQATLRNLFKNLDSIGLPHRPAKLPVSSRPLVLAVWTGTHWVEVLCRSLENFGALSGIEVAWFWLDEVWATPREAYDLIIGRARDSKFRPEPQGLLTTTTDEPSSWLYGEFVEGFDPERMTVVTATSFDNPMLPATYLRNLKASYSPKLYERMVLAKWVSLEAGHIYHSFDRGVHGRETAFDEDLPLLVAQDFNIGQDAPMSSAVCQIRKGRSLADGHWRNELHAVDELVLDSTDTHDTLDEFESRWLDRLPGGKDQVVFYGDASGRSRDTRSKTSDWGIIRSRGYTKQKVPKANPPIRTRHNAVNSVLQTADGDVRFRADPGRCKTILRGLETGRLRKGATGLEEPGRDSHVVVALGYLVMQEFPLPGTGSVQTIRMAI